MTSGERMLKLLSQTHLYSLENKSPTSIEFSLYAVYFEAWYGLLDEMLQNMFVSTVASDELYAYHLLFCLPNNLSSADTRELVAKRLSITTMDFTPLGIKRCLASGGINAEFTEDFANNKVTVKIISQKNVFGSDILRNEFIKSCLPYGVDMTVVNI